MMDMVFRFLENFGSVLSGREDGAQAYLRLKTMLEKLPNGDVLVVDLSGVKMLNPSYADETIGEAFVKFPGKIRVNGTISLGVDRSLAEVEKSRNISIPRPAIAS